MAAQKIVGKAFKNNPALLRWLGHHHARAEELWILLYTKDSGLPSVTWEGVVACVLRWGWIDGRKQKNDALSWLLRITPRRPRSNWSERNKKIARSLIREGLMEEPGLAAIKQAKSCGQWQKVK